MENQSKSVKNREALIEAWPRIVQVFRRTPYVSIASVNEDGSPHVSPIGSVLLDYREPKGVFLQRFTTALPKNLDREERVTLMAVDAGAGLWLRGLFQGRFSKPPGVRLSGRATGSRPSTEAERARFHRRVKAVRWLKGHDLLWGDLSMARELQFDSFKPVILGAMTKGLWSG